MVLVTRQDINRLCYNLEYACNAHTQVKSRVQSAQKVECGLFSLTSLCERDLASSHTVVIASREIEKVLPNANVCQFCHRAQC